MLLHFRDRGWDVLTSSWTLAAKNDTQTELVYTWSSETNARITLKIGIKQLLARISNSDKICDLMDVRS